MKLAPLLLASATIASAYVAHDPRQEELIECCYIWQIEGTSSTQLFRSKQLKSQVIGEPGSWCIANVVRDPNDPNNCAAGKATIVGGYCDASVPAVAVQCP